MLEKLELQIKKRLIFEGSISKKLNEHEKVMVKGELVAGIFVNAASVIMRLGCSNDNFGWSTF